MYGDVELIGAGNSILIICQLTFAGYIIIMLDEMLSKVMNWIILRDMD